MNADGTTGQSAVQANRGRGFKPRRATACSSGNRFINRLSPDPQTHQAECRWDYIAATDTRPERAVGLAPTCLPDPEPFGNAWVASRPGESALSSKPTQDAVAAQTGCKFKQSNTGQNAGGTTSLLTNRAPKGRMSRPPLVCPT